VETGLMRTLLALAALLFSAGEVCAGGKCDLDSVVGYQVVFGKQIVGYIQASKKTKGYEGCEPDRVLLFADGSGLRCKELDLQHLDAPPMGYLFGKSMSDLKLCVEGELFGVTPSN
jgi:hypothetical protein